MINIENDVYTAVRQAVLANYPDTFVTGVYVRAPEQFPCVSVTEMDNAALVGTQDTGSMENHASIMYEVNVYSNKAAEKKSECRAIATVVDNVLSDLGFTRTMLNPIPNLDDASIYRVTGRYTAVVSKNETIYRR